MILSRLVPAVLLAVSVMFGPSVVAAAELPSSTRTGVVVTPRNFPNHDLSDMTDMFRLSQELGNYAIVRFNWNDANRASAAKVLMDLASQKRLEVVLEISPYKADGLSGASLDPPGDVGAGGGRVSLSNPVMAEAFTRAVLELAQLRPGYLAIATDVNLVAQKDPAEFAALNQLYASLYPRIKKASPSTRVFVTFQWDAMLRADATESRRQLEAFRPALDILAFTSAPRQRFENQGIAGIPKDYYTQISALTRGRGPLLLELNWPSDGRTGEAAQVDFIQAIPDLTASLKPAMVAWTFLHDIRILVFTVRAGLIGSDGRQKPAYAAFLALGGARAPIDAKVVSPVPASRSVASRRPAKFGVFLSKLDGSDVETLITNPELEMTHPRVSPDGQRVVITRYHNRGKDGRATEEGGYLNTEIMVVNTDGTGEETIVAPKAGIIAANGGWTPDGKSITFLSTDNPQRSPEIRVIDLETRKINRMPTPPGLKTTDPHWHGQQLVFPSKGEHADELWIMNVDGSAARQITRHTRQRPKGTNEDFGDFDPRLSPDGSKVAFMRIFGGTGWRVVVLDLKINEERVLTPNGVIEGIPNWSSDGRLLIFRHIELDRPRAIGIYTMRPDGSSRSMVPLPRGYLYNHPSFFPGDGSAAGARIIFTGTETPGL